MANPVDDLIGPVWMADAPLEEWERNAILRTLELALQAMEEEK